MSTISPPLEDYMGDCIGPSHLCRDNAFLLLNEARILKKPSLVSRCMRFIDQNVEDILTTESFTEINLDTLLAVLERDYLRVREAQLFQAVVRWSEAECRRVKLPLTVASKRSVVGRAVSLVRFPLMTVHEFALGPAQSGLLNDREVVSLFLYFIVNINPSPTLGFLTVPRYCTSNRFRQVDRRWGYNGATDRIRFVVDHSIFLVGFGLFGSIEGPREYEVSILLLHTDSGGVCARNEVTCTSDGSRDTFRVMFKDAFKVRPDTSYTAAAKVKGPDSHYGSEGMRNVVTECHSDVKVTFKFSSSEGENNFTSVSIGQIPEILFYV